MPWYVLNDPGLYRYHPNNMGAAAGKVQVKTTMPAYAHPARTHARTYVTGQNMYDIMGYTNSSKACSLLFDDIASNVVSMH